jgi:hypothetical protein
MNEEAAMTDPARTTPTLGDRILALLPSRAPSQRLAAEDPATPAGEPVHLSVAEIYLRLSKDELRERDLLCVVAAAFEADGGACELESLYPLSPESLRSRAAPIPTGVIIGGVPVGTVSNRVTRVGLVLYSLPRARGTGRVVEAIQSLTSAAHSARTAEGRRALLAGVVDRLELLAQTPQVATVLAGVHRPGGGGEGHYALFVAARSEGASGDSIGGDATYHVRNGRLCAGRSREVASPWRGGEFVLLSVGAGRGGSDPYRFDHLRRQHALVGGGAARDEAKVAPETYQLKLDRLRLANRLSAVYGRRGARRLPVTTPVTVSVTSDLEGLVQLRGELSPDLASQLTLMRDGLKYELGCEFPHVRVTTSPGPSSESYTFAIEETPVISGTLKPDRLFCHATVEQLRALDISAEEATNPANGNRCAWARPDDARVLESAGFSTRTPVGYLVLHLSSLLRKNASTFVGVEAVAALLRARGKYDAIRAAPGGLPRFTDVIRGLLDDEVPIHELSAICNRYLEVTDRPTYEILEEIRALEVVSGVHFWNKADTPIYRLGERFVRLMERGITGRGEATVLALKPAPTQRALAVVRTEVAALPPVVHNPVIFCEDWRMRPFVRKLVELEFPHLRVVSRRELTNPEGRTVVGTLELEGGTSEEED